VVKTEPFLAERYLASKEAQADLLNDAFATGDAGYIANALGVVARAQGMSEVAKTAGITREALYKSLSDAGDPKLTTVLGVMRALGMAITTHPV
jgi:probable addiction module antidote protein